MATPLRQTSLSPSIDSSNALAYLAAGLRDASVGLVTNHPGFRSNELHAAYHGAEAIISANERTAFAVAWGHAMAGGRAAVALKNVGLNDAADGFINAQMLETSAALLVIVFDDTDVEHSQIRMDSRHYHALASSPWLEPASAIEARAFASVACEWSERCKMPVVLRVTNALLARASSTPPERPASAKQLDLAPFRRDPANRVVHPSNHLIQEASLHGRKLIAQELSFDLFNRYNPDWTEKLAANEELHLLVGSARPSRDFEASQVLRLPSLPVPSVLAKHGERLRWVVHEHGDPVVADELRRQLGSRAVHTVTSGGPYPNRTYHCRNELDLVYALLRSAPDPIVVGDLGGHTMNRERSLDACLCYGASIAVALGAWLARPQSTVSCVIGDGAFLHSGRAALDEAATRRAELLVILLENGGCRGTGGQLPPGSTSASQPAWIERSCSYDPEVPEEALACIREMLALPGLRLLHLATRF